MQEDKQLSLIQKFLFEELSEEEKILFRERFKQDETFADEVRFYTDMILSVGALEKLKALEEEDGDSGKVRQIRLARIIIGVAASIMLVLGGVWVYYSVQTVTSNDLYLSYFHAYKSPNMSLRADSLNERLLTAIQSYNEGNYQVALSHFHTELLENPDNALLIFYTGQCYLNTDMTEEAIKAFSRVVVMDDIDYSEAARWYLALAYLKNNNLYSLEKELKLIIDSESKYRDDAIKLLEELEKIE